MARKIITAFEFGNELVKVASAEIVDGKGLMVTAYEAIESKNSVQKGELVDVETLSEQLVKLIEIFEEKHKVDIENSHRFTFICSYPTMKSQDNVAMLRLAEEGEEARKISDEDIREVVKEACSPPLEDNRQVLTTFDKGYIVDGSRRSRTPEGLIGHTLESEVHIVTANKNSLDTSMSPLMDFFGRQNYSYTPKSLASASSCMSSEDQEKGALAIDIGAGMCDFSFFQARGCQASGCIPVGAKNVINDLSVGLEIEYLRAKRLLEEEGRAISRRDARQRLIELKSLGGNQIRQIPRSSIEMICEVRLRELFVRIKDSLRSQGIRSFEGVKIYLCGGLAALPELNTLAGEEFQAEVETAEVKVDLLSGDRGFLKDPSYVALAGALKIAFDHHLAEEFKSNPLRQGAKMAFREFIESIKDAIRL